MSPGAHFIGSLLVASVTTDSPRDRRLVTLAGILPDLDGLGMVVDVAKSLISGQETTFHYYQKFHHLESSPSGFVKSNPDLIRRRFVLCAFRMIRPLLLYSELYERKT